MEHLDDKVIAPVEEFRRGVKKDEMLRRQIEEETRKREEADRENKELKRQLRQLKAHPI